MATLLVLALTTTACAAPRTGASPRVSESSRPHCTTDWPNDPTLARAVWPAKVAPKYEETKRKLSSPSRWARQMALNGLTPEDASTEPLSSVLDGLVSGDPSPYVRSEAARLRLGEAGKAPRNFGGMFSTKSYAGAWDTRPEELAKVVGAVRARSAAIPQASFDAAAEGACFPFPRAAEATLKTSRGTFVSASAGEFGCLVALFSEPEIGAEGRAPVALPMCATVLFAVREVVYGVYRLDHMDGTYELYRAAPSTTGELEISSVTLPDAPRGAYALSDGTLLIDTGEAAVHVDEEGIASVRPRAQVAGLSATTEGLGGY